MALGTCLAGNDSRYTRGVITFSSLAGLWKTIGHMEHTPVLVFLELVCTTRLEGWCCSRCRPPLASPSTDLSEAPCLRIEGQALHRNRDQRHCVGEREGSRASCMCRQLSARLTRA